VFSALWYTFFEQTGGFFPKCWLVAGREGKLKLLVGQAIVSISSSPRARESMNPGSHYHKVVSPR